MTEKGVKRASTFTAFAFTRRVSTKTSIVATTVSPNCGSVGARLLSVATGAPAKRTALCDDPWSAATAKTATAATTTATIRIGGVRRALTAVSGAGGAARAIA